MNHSQCFDCKTKTIAPKFCNQCKYGGKPNGTSWKVTDDYLNERQKQLKQERLKRQSEFDKRLKDRQREINERLQGRLDKQTDSLDRKLEELKRKLEGASDRAYKKIPTDYPPSGDKKRDYARKYRNVYDYHDRPVRKTKFEPTPTIFDTLRQMWKDSKTLTDKAIEATEKFFSFLLKKLKEGWEYIDNWMRT